MIAKLTANTIEIPINQTPIFIANLYFDKLHLKSLRNYVIVSEYGISGKQYYSNTKGLHGIQPPMFVQYMYPNFTLIALHPISYNFNAESLNDGSVIVREYENRGQLYYDSNTKGLHGIQPPTFVQYMYPNAILTTTNPISYDFNAEFFNRGGDVLLLLNCADEDVRRSTFGKHCTLLKNGKNHISLSRKYTKKGRNKSKEPLTNSKSSMHSFTPHYAHNQDSKKQSSSIVKSKTSTVSNIGFSHSLRYTPAPSPYKYNPIRPYQPSATPTSGFIPISSYYPSYSPSSVLFQSKDLLTIDDDDEIHKSDKETGKEY